MIAMTLDLENFEEVKLKGEELYKSLTEVRCPYFNDRVDFNTQGLQHLKFKRHGHARPRQDQYMRFKLLHLAPVILSNSKTLQGIWKTKSFEKIRIHSRTDTIMKDITYYEFVAVMENVRVKVIVKQAEAVTFIGAWLQLTLSRERANPPNTYLNYSNWCSYCNQISPMLLSLDSREIRYFCKIYEIQAILTKNIK